MHAVILSRLTSTGACWSSGSQPTNGSRVRSYPLPPDSREQHPSGVSGIEQPHNLLACACAKFALDSSLHQQP
ncbi:hypothetical protein LZ32DRAFT_611250 [Colletotrichum eremochloae]|nr:hypothetical protein LY78DRAFT_653043 [Colletotrichum sublineola]KAK2006446.1 hypothetical protein LZ32DRAFT_611250 [Colletotrichum eremochloae]